MIELPPPDFGRRMTVEEALNTRRSVREYADESLTLEQIAQLLWAAQGVTQPHPYGLRTAPSAGALYPLELYLLSGRVEGLDAGIYKYQPKPHRLIKVAEGDERKALYRAALRQECVRDAPAVIVIAAVYDRVKVKYGERGVRYTHIEVGAAAQNIYLEAESLGLGTVIVGAFQDDRVRLILQMEEGETPLAIMPVGKKK